MKKNIPDSEIDEMVSEALFYTGLKFASEKYNIPEADLYKLCRSTKRNQLERHKKLSFYKSVNISPKSPRKIILNSIGIEILDYDIITQHNLLRYELFYLRKKIVSEELNGSSFHDFLCKLIEHYKNDKDDEIDEIVDNFESPIHAFETTSAGAIFFESVSYLVGSMIHFESSSFFMSRECIDKSINKIRCIDSKIDVNKRLVSRKNIAGGVGRGKQMSLAKKSKIDGLEKNNFDEEIFKALKIAKFRLIKSGTGRLAEFIAKEIYDQVSGNYSDPNGEYDLTDMKQLRMFVQNRLEESKKLKSHIFKALIEENKKEIMADKSN